MQQSFQTIKQLVTDFKAQEAAYLSSSYQEPQVRQDFIDKFFTALGWDVTHERQKNPYEQEVHIENRVRMPGSSQRRADYAFFLSPNFRDPKFFIEAKKPSRNLANADDYYQAIRYGWNAKTPLAILTDFEEFHILDCRFKPNIDEALSRKIESFRYSDYAVEDKFARLYYLFSREAVAGGSIEKRAAELPKPRGKGGQRGVFKGGYQAVDEAFLEELDEYRITLAKAFKKANEKLEGEELTEAVQRTIDRLVFIRFLEDKGIEEKAIVGLKGQKSAWKAFVSLCKGYEPKYNGLVFKSNRILDNNVFEPSEDKLFAEICEELADPASPYDFNQIPISILGSIYERFLGKVVHATDKRVKVEEKPEVRKAGGVYYTPEYIVRYIVKETVGKLIEGKTPGEIAQLAFADIACGSGSFLIEVYAQLLDYHVRYYQADRDKGKADEVFEREGQLQLTLKKKKEILANNIYGVDIDFQATEVTQLSLYLKLLEDATMSDAHQFGLFKETILPDLRENIICGNSLIGTDIGGLGIDSFDYLRPLDITSAFQKTARRGGFDAIVGNPPYIRMEEFKDIKEYLKKHYKVHSERADIFYYFLERAISLLRAKGAMGYIVSNTFTRSSAGMNLRGLLTSQLEISTIVEFGDFTPFADASVYPLILIATKGTSGNKSIEFALQDEDPVNNPGTRLFQRAFSLDENAVSERVWVFEQSNSRELREKLIRENKNLGDLFGQVRMGIKTGLNEAFIIDDKTRKRILTSSPAASDIIKPYVAGEEMDRWVYRWDHKWLIYTYHGIDVSKLPGVLKHLEGFKKALMQRATEQKWYELQQPQEGYAKLLDGHKIIYPDLSRYPKFSLDKKGSYFSNTGYFISTDSLYLLAVLNSKLLWFVIRGLSNAMRGGLWRFRLFSGHIEKLPIHTIDLNDSADKSRQDRIVRLVEEIVRTKEKTVLAQTEAEENRLRIQCDTLDRQIDEAVYELYGLTAEEIRIVEGK
jgi:type I restriction-modification system DNA methylase subunit